MTTKALVIFNMTYIKNSFVEISCSSFIHPVLIGYLYFIINIKSARESFDLSFNGAIDGSLLHYLAHVRPDKAVVYSLFMRN